jgi:hypothetical protein
VTAEEAVRARIMAIAAVTALVGTRVYMQKLPESPKYPLVRVQFIDDAVPFHLRGPVGVRPARIQVDAIARDGSGVDSYDSAARVLEAIDGDGLGKQATGLAGFIGGIGSPPFEIVGVFPQSKRTDYDPEELRIVTHSRDYIVWTKA